MAHVASLPNKIGLPADAYLTVQQIYRGWAAFGFLLFAALAAILALVVLDWRKRRPVALELAALVLLAASLGVFFAWTEPANAATQYWTMLPDNWEQLRAAWEYSHAAAACLVLLAFSALALASIRRAA
jgi:hypothetical protein